MNTDRWNPDVVAERVRRNVAERGLARTLAGAYSDPGAYTPRGDNYEEQIHAWATRAIGIVLDHAVTRMPKGSDPAPNGKHWDEFENPAEWVDLLPPERHVPHWDDLASPKSFICVPCSMREEGVIYGWPCAVAQKHGRAIAEAYGWELSK